MRARICVKRVQGRAVMGAAMGRGRGVMPLRSLTNVTPNTMQGKARQHMTMTAIKKPPAVARPKSCII
eukprot:SAG31_NODE_5227_length_2662_cov_3.874756_2_plen_68_part_00